jgi:hypothetical protein
MTLLCVYNVNRLDFVLERFCVATVTTGLNVSLLSEYNSLSSAGQIWVLLLLLLLLLLSSSSSKGPVADATNAPQPWRLIVQPYDEDGVFSAFTCNGSPVEWNWQGKTEVLGEKPVPVPLCPPQIPHGLKGDWTQASAVRGRRLTAWAMARPQIRVRSDIWNIAETDIFHWWIRRTLKSRNITLTATC